MRERINGNLLAERFADSCSLILCQGLGDWYEGIFTKQSRHAVPCDATHVALAWQMKTLAPSSPQTIEEAEILAVDAALRSGPKSCTCGPSCYRKLSTLATPKYLYSPRWALEHDKHAYMQDSVDLLENVPKLVPRAAGQFDSQRLVRSSSTQ